MKQDIEAFLTYLSVEDFSQNTLAAYHNDLTQFTTFIEREVEKQGLDSQWSVVDHPLLLSYIMDLRRRSYASTTVARKVAAIKSFFSFLVDKGTVERNLALNLGSPRVGRSLPKPLTIDQVKELLQQPNKSSTPEAKRDKAMLELLYATGVRVSELVSLDVDDVNLQKGEVFCRGRGSQRRVIPMNAAVDAVRKYLGEGRPQLLHRQEDRALFLNRRGERLTRQGFWQILKGYAKAANLRTRVTPHTLRHSFAIHLLNQGVALSKVQNLLGHANISTTQVYTQLAHAGRW